MGRFSLSVILISASIALTPSAAVAQQRTAEDWLALDAFNVQFQGANYKMTLPMNLKEKRTTFTGQGTCNNGNRPIEASAQGGKVVIMIKPVVDFCEVIKYTMDPDGSPGIVEISADKGGTWRTSTAKVSLQQ